MKALCIKEFTFIPSFAFGHKKVHFLPGSVYFIKRDPFKGAAKIYPYKGSGTFIRFSALSFNDYFKELK